MKSYLPSFFLSLAKRKCSPKCSPICLKGCICRGNLYCVAFSGVLTFLFLCNSLCFYGADFLSVQDSCPIEWDSLDSLSSYSDCSHFFHVLSVLQILSDTQKGKRTKLYRLVQKFLKTKEGNERKLMTERIFLDYLQI